ncbi:MAG: NUDIX hydrolase [FCB group bacterium]|nr:NUDIX hydrolase [FCB group bacterium]
MTIEPSPLAWNYCPICGVALVLCHDGESDRPCCRNCSRFYYSNPVPAACCFVRRNGDELLFVQRAVEPGRGLWTLPGGFVEVGETTDEAALRELAEETNLIGRGTRLIGANTQLSRLSGAVVVMAYLVEKWEGDPVPATDAMALGFFPRDRRPPIAFQAHRELIALYDALSELGD